MQNSVSSIPELPALTKGLASVLGDIDATDGKQVAVLHRHLNVFASTFPSEIVTCLLPDGTRLRLFCKYSSDRSHTAYGHRGDVSYEAEVYRRVLEHSQLSTPRFYGAYSETTAQGVWLLIEYVEDGKRLSNAPESDAIISAARWIGGFHAQNESYQAEDLLKRYDADYYRRWAYRAGLFGGSLGRKYSWLGILVKRFEDYIRPLVEAPATVIHGEYYPQNVLIRDGTVYPIDWESAAIGAGEIDLASLTQRWPADIVRRCAMEYCRARWPNGTPGQFEYTLIAARLYWHFRWLGDRPEWALQLPRLERLRSLGEQLGLI